MYTMYLRAIRRKGIVGLKRIKESEVSAWDYAIFPSEIKEYRCGVYEYNGDAWVSLGDGWREFLAFCSARRALLLALREHDVVRKMWFAEKKKEEDTDA